MKIKNQCRKKQKGQGLVEYLIIVAIIAVGTMSIMRTMGGQLSSRFAKVTEALGGQVDGNIENYQISASSHKKRDLKNFFNGAQGSSKNETKKDD